MPKHIDCNVFQIIVIDAVIKGEQGIVSVIYGWKSGSFFTLSSLNVCIKYTFEKVGACMSI